MTVPNTTCRVSYVGTNSTPVYPFTFLLFQAADLVVQAQATTTSAPITLALTTDYTVTGVGSYSGGSITLTAGNLATGVVLSIFRDPAQVQLLLLQEQTAYNAQANMGAYDDLTMMVLALQDQVSRCIQIDPLDPTTPTSGVPGPPWPSTILPPMALGLGQNILRDSGTGTFLYGTATGGTTPYLILSTGSTQTVTGPIAFTGTVSFSNNTSVVTQSPGSNNVLAANTAFVTTAVNNALTTVASAYLTITTAASTYLTQANAASTYQTIANTWRTFNVYVTTQNFTVPTGVTEIEVNMWGGGAAPTGGVGTVGGGGGGYLYALIAVTPGQTLNLTIGAGGAATSGTGNNGGNTTIQINGGAAILTAGGGQYNGTGGTYSSTVGAQGINGQGGGLGVGAGAISGYVVAGTGGDSPRGGAGGPGGLAGAAAGYAGQAPGGGGSSAFPGSGQLSGAGGLGQITLRY